MDQLWIVIAAVAALVVIFAVILLLRKRASTPPVPRLRPGVDYTPGVGDDASIPRDTPRRTIESTVVSDALVAPHVELTEPETIPDESDAIWEIEVPEPAQGRFMRLKDRLARSNSVFGRGLLTLLGRSDLDAATWDEVEEVLLTADLGVGPTDVLMTQLRTRVRAGEDPASIAGIVREELLALVDPAMSRQLNVGRVDGTRPSVVLIVGVNGTGKTTTTGKIARLLIAENQAVVLGAADTFRAAAAEQLQTWGDRVGAAVVRGPEGADPASVAFEAVSIAQEAQADSVIIDTAGRLHTKTGLMDELGKVKRVIEKQSEIDEVLLVLDATTGQNGLVQAQVFAEVVPVTGVVLTKLDGTAKGGIVVAVQQALGVPVKLVGLGEGPDDLAPFDAQTFVNAIVSS
jgi:fused signal recognition particle receptor